MSKYINAEKLKAEIERRQEVNHRMADNAINSNMRNFYDGEEDCCKQLISVIDSLQQEQPSLPSNLYEVAKQLYPIITEEAKSDEWKIANREYNDMCIKLRDAFGKGAELMARQMKQKQSEKSIEINGIRYKEVPAKTDDKICKECDYFLDNGSCNFDDCPCTCADNILERIQQEQPEVDLEKEITRWLNEGHITDTRFDDYDDADIETTARHFYELGLDARKED